VSVAEVDDSVEKAGLRSRILQVAGHPLNIVYGGKTTGPIILFLHGYPDSSRVWYEQMQALGDEYRVVSFDLRGVGGSGPPRAGRDYHIESLLPDIDAVLREIGGEEAKAHLVGHDWGSTIGWSFVCHPVFRERVLSWTSMSGPHLGIWMRWIFEGLRSLRPRRVLSVLGQLLKSSYVLFLLAFPLPEIAWTVFGVAGWRAILRIAGVPRQDPMLQESRSKVLSMALRPMSLYRRNVLRPPQAPPKQSITVPTLLIISSGDAFVSEASFDNLHEYVCDLTVHRIGGTHWAQRSHPEIIAEQIRGFCTRHTENSPG